MDWSSVVGEVGYVEKLLYVAWLMTVCGLREYDGRENILEFLLKIIYGMLFGRMWYKGIVMFSSLNFCSICVFNVFIVIYCVFIVCRVYYIF